MVKRVATTFILPQDVRIPISECKHVIASGTCCEYGLLSQDLHISCNSRDSFWEKVGLDIVWYGDVWGMGLSPYRIRSVDKEKNSKVNDAE